jgi:hypothetical protein
VPLRSNNRHPPWHVRRRSLICPTLTSAEGPMRRKWSAGSLAATAERQSSSRCVSLPTCSAVRWAAASSQSTSANRRNRRRPLAFRAICSSWPGSGQKPSKRPFVSDGADGLGEARPSPAFGTERPNLPQGPFRLRAGLDLTVNRRGAGKQEAHDELTRQPNPSRPCIGGILAPTAPNNNARDYGDRLRVITEHSRSDAWDRGSAGSRPNGDAH